MKNIKSIIQEKLILNKSVKKSDDSLKNDSDNIAMEIQCAFSDLVDDDCLPIPCTLIIEKKYAKEFSDFGKKEECNLFIHFDNNIDVCY